MPDSIDVEIESGETDITGLSVAVPERSTVVVSPVVLDVVNVSVPLKTPAPSGSKETPKAPIAPAGTISGSSNSGMENPSPVTEMSLTSRLVSPVFSKVMSNELLVPATTVPKSSDSGSKERTGPVGGTVPSPRSARISKDNEANAGSTAVRSVQSGNPPSKADPGVMILAGEPNASTPPSYQFHRSLLTAVGCVV